MKRSQRKRQSQIADKEQRGKDEQRIYEKRTQLKKETKTCQEAEEHTQQQVRIKRTARAVPTAGRDVRGEQCLEERSWIDDKRQGY